MQMHRITVLKTMSSTEAFFGAWGSSSTRPNTSTNEYHEFVVLLGMLIFVNLIKTSDTERVRLVIVFDLLNCMLYYVIAERSFPKS